MEHIMVPVPDKQSGSVSDDQNTKEWAQFDLKLRLLLRRLDRLSKNRETKGRFAFFFFYFNKGREDWYRKPRSHSWATAPSIGYL